MFSKSVVPQDLRLRRESCPLGHVPHVWEREHIPLNTKHMGEGRDTIGEGEAGTQRGGWARGCSLSAPLNKEDLFSYEVAFSVNKL